jgi:hypothetical protein
MVKRVRVLLEYHPQRVSIPIAHGCKQGVKELHGRFDRWLMKIELQSVMQLS